MNLQGKGIKEEDGRLRLEGIDTLLVYLTNHHLSDWSTKVQHMAGSVVSFIAEKLGNLLVEEVILLQEVHDQVEWLERQMRWMQAFLKDADAKRRVDGVAYCVNQVREVVFDAEDVVDIYILKMHQHQLHGFIRTYTCFCQKPRVRHSIGMEIQRIKSRLQEIYSHTAMYGISYINMGGIQEQMSSVDKTVKERRELAIQKNMNVVVGFEDDMQYIMKVLFDKEKKRRCVISLVGMGGLGKSTLVKRICHEKRVKEEFHDRCALVSVSQSYTLSKLLKGMAEGLPNFRERLDKNKDEEVEIKGKLRKFLKEGKYLIVLDNVWGSEAWTLIQPYLPDEQNGSRVIITTRFMEVARSADPSTSPHQLKTLDETESWDLFTKIVFVDEDDVETVCTGNLKDLGKEIVKNCGGLPLALVVMGGLLSTKERSVRAWQTVMEGFNWVESPEGEVPLKALALSYEALPQYLKSCFLYFSAFPEDFVISAEKLIRLWIAEGFVPDETRKQQRRMGRTMEEIAQGWLEDLIQRCLIQVVEIRPSGRVLKCRAHDLVLDLAIKEGEEVNFFHTCQGNMVGHISPPNTARRLALHDPCTDQQGRTSLDFSTPKLRTFLGIKSGGIRSLQFVKRLQLLRVLDLEGTECTELPSAIGDIIHLRYLGLESNWLCSIPTSIRKLQNLQTLDLRRSFLLSRLPASLWGIRALRHVLTSSWTAFQISDKVDLVNLQTLKYAKAGSWIQKTLATMRNLRVLAICDILPTHHHALAESLDCLLHLQRLTLASGGGTTGGGVLPRKALALPNHHHLEELNLYGTLLLGDPNTDANDAPPSYSIHDLPPNLCALRLYGCELQQDTWSLLEKLPHLKCLKLTNDAYVGEEAVCSAGAFPQLELLKLQELKHIKRLRIEGAEAMPRLNLVVIKFCPQLEELPPHFKNRSTLDIDDDE